METKNIYTALSDFQKEVKAVPLTKEVSVTTKTGGSYKFRYAPLPQIIETIQPVMEKTGLSFTQTISKDEIVTSICHKSGEAITSNIPFPMPKTKTDSKGEVPLTAQEVGSWITYLRRYGLVTALGLVAEEDDDANVASGNQFAAKPYAKKAQPVSDLKPCDKCGSNLILRNSVKGKFYGCSNYPKCKRTLTVEDAEMWKKDNVQVAKEVFNGELMPPEPPPYN